MDIQEKTKEITQETVENANKKPICFATDRYSQCHTRFFAK